MPIKRKSARYHPNIVQQAGIKIVYEPRGSFVDFFHDHGEELLLSAEAGTGKSRAALEKIHLILSKYAGASFFMARKTRSSMTNSCMKTFEREVIKPQDKVWLHKQEQVYNYPNGSQLAISGLDDPEKIKSTEWDGGYIQEATECTQNDWEMCGSRLRASVVPYQQLIGDCNPDKPTHWLKLRETRGLVKMYHSTMKDNPKWWNGWYKNKFYEGWTPPGAAYDLRMSRLTGVRRSRLYLGLWVAAEGVVYETWDPLVNMIYKSQLPEHWEEWDHYWAIDWGYIHPFVWGDYILNPETNQLILLHQIYKTRVLVEDHARHIAKITDGRMPRAIICDHDASDRATFEKHISLAMGEKIGQPDLKMLTLPAYKPIAIGIQNLQTRITPDPMWGGGPGFLIVRDSLQNEPDHELVEMGAPISTEQEFDGYVWDVKHNEDVNSRKDEIPIDKDNHGMDKARYIAAFIDDLAIDPQETEDVVTLNDDYGSLISPY